MLALMALAASPVVTLVKNPDVHMAPICQPVGATPVRDDGKARFSKLNELPNANMYLGVIRIGPDGCNKPAIVRYDIGNNPKGH